MTTATEIMENGIGADYPSYDARYCHDPNGNMASFADGCGTTTYAWDSNDRLVSISGYSPDCSALAASYTYDALGRRIAKTINGETTKYLYDGADIIMELNASDQDMEVFYTYDAGGNLTNIQVTNTPASGDIDFGFGYNAAGMRNSISYPIRVIPGTQYLIIDWPLK